MLFDDGSVGLVYNPTPHKHRKAKQALEFFFDRLKCRGDPRHLFIYCICACLLCFAPGEHSHGCAFSITQVCFLFAS